jgi:hypothetical protein
MGRGGSGPGWSMSVWPRYMSREGQDPKSPRISKPKKRAARGVKSDPEKFEAALTKAVGEKAAKKYIRRLERAKSKKP